MTKVSVVIITFNSAEYIEECLHSVHDWVDEIVVCDLGSTDDTLQLIERYDVQLLRRPWVPFADRIRDEVSREVRGEWVLQLDPDERVPPALAHLLKRIASEDRYDVVRIPRQNSVFERVLRYGGFWPDWQIRFGRKEKLTFPTRIHHTASVHQRKVLDLPISEDYALHHFPLPDLHTVFERMNRYAQEQAKEYIASNCQLRTEDLFSKPIRSLYNAMIVREAYRDGVPGIVFALLWHFIYPLLVQLYQWESLNPSQHNATQEIPHRSSRGILIRIIREKTVRAILLDAIVRDFPGRQAVQGSLKVIKRVVIRTRRK